jgi:mannose-6-phosphate isomerase-like protein (cupin superfamily)
MRFALALGVAFAVGALVGSAAGVPMRVHYVPSDTVSSTMVKGGQIINDNGLIVIANRATARGSEVHAKTNHLFIIVEGEATFVTGGTLTNARETAPGQIRGDGIEGGETRQLRKGDVITIPANTPHWWKDTSKSGSVGYYAINIEQ